MQAEFTTVLEANSKEFEDYKKDHESQNEPGGTSTEALIEALQEKAAVQESYDKLKFERDEMETEFHNKLNAK